MWAPQMTTRPTKLQRPDFNLEAILALMGVLLGFLFIVVIYFLEFPQEFLTTWGMPLIMFLTICYAIGLTIMGFIISHEINFYLANKMLEIEPEKFGIADWRGEVFVLEKLIMELACLNKVEVLAWERWGICSEVKNIESLGYDVFDELAEKISNINQPETFQELKNLFETDPRYKIPEDYEPLFLDFKN